MISFIESFKRELESESVQTRRMLQVVPAEKMEWRPHPKSMTIKALAGHLAEMPLMIALAINQDEWDFANNPYPPVDMNTAGELVTRFDWCIQEAKAALDKGSDDNLLERWILRAGDQVYMDITKWEAIRHAFGQNAHHRAQLGVFLRILDIPIPGPYGPSADEMG